MFPGTADANIARGILGWARAAGFLGDTSLLAGEDGNQKSAGMGCCHFSDFFGCACSHDQTAFRASLWSNINDPIRALDDFQVVLDDDDAFSLFDEAVEDIDQQRDIIKVEACCGFVKNEHRLLIRFAGEVMNELEALGLTSAQRVDGLTKAKVVQADL